MAVFCESLAEVPSVPPVCHRFDHHAVIRCPGSVAALSLSQHLFGKDLRGCACACDGVAGVIVHTQRGHWLPGTRPQLTHACDEPTRLRCTMDVHAALQLCRGPSDQPCPGSVLQ